MHPLLEWLRKILPTPIRPVAQPVTEDLSFIEDGFLEPAIRGAIVDDFADEISVASDAEERALQAQFEAELEKLANTPSGQIWLWHPADKGYREVVLGPFLNDDQAKQYLANKRAQQRGNHQEYFTQRPDAAPRHGGDLFVMPGTEWLFVGYEDYARVKMREIIANRKGEGWDHNQWEVEQAGRTQVW